MATEKLYDVTFFPSALHTENTSIGRKTKTELVAHIKDTAKLFGDVSLWFFNDYMWVVYGGSVPGVYVLAEDGE